MKPLKYNATGSAPRARSRVPRAFSTMFVIASMVFLGMAVMGMTTLFAHEARRTRAALAETQLRQLLLAAVPAAQAELKTNPGPRDVNLAVPVDGATVMLHLTGDTVRVAAQYRGFNAAQTLVFSNGQLTSATLDQTGGQ